ncbi:DUF3048 domain-containing protein [Patescibacteria group bacterium]|nr:DUF3048 domain-containing protein [Patescibacteria group bacterium]
MPISDNLSTISSLRSDDTNSSFVEEEVTNKKEPDKNHKFAKIFKISFYIFSILVFLGSFSYFIYFFYLDSIKEYSSKILLKIKSPYTVSNNVEKNNLPFGKSVKENLFYNPINGLPISEDLSKDLSTRKPVAIMLNNHTDSRPQAGITDADIIYEISAEGGISRLMPIFYSKIPERVGSVRSVRVYFMQIAAEYFPIFSHWGAAFRPVVEKNMPKAEFDVLLAKGLAETDPRADARGYGDSINLAVANTDTAPNLFYRESGLNVAIEHTGFAKFSQVYTEFKKFYSEDKWSVFEPFKLWQFSDKEISGGIPVNSITYNFWSWPEFESIFTYNPTSKLYKRSQGGVVTVDRNTNKAIEIKTLIVQKAVQTELNDKKKHLLFDVIGEGTATVYTNGKKYDVKWKKPSARERTVFSNLDGSEFTFPRGLIWVSVIPSENVVTEK